MRQLTLCATVAVLGVSLACGGSNPAGPGGLSGITVVDLMCRTVLDATANHAADGFHPNDSGYSVMAGEVVTAFTSSSYPPPIDSCGQMTLF